MLFRSHHVFHRAHGFVDRGAYVEAVKEQHVDVVGLQALQARLDRAHDVARRRTSQLACVIHRQPELGREHDVLALIAEDAPEQPDVVPQPGIFLKDVFTIACASWQERTLAALVLPASTCAKIPKFNVLRSKRHTLQVGH